MNEVEMNDVLRNCNSLKPNELIICDLKWKYLIRAILRSKNVMIVGPSGCGKTHAARCASTVLKRPFFVFNCGGGQDARATLIGNTIFRKDSGTLFCKSPFINALQTDNAVILLDELSRGTHDFWNILFPVLDPTQRCLRLDEQENSPVVNIGKNVCFVATANVGNEYTATKVIDRALSRRFPIKLEMSPLSQAELIRLFDVQFKNRNDSQIKMMKTLASISEDLISQCKLEDAKISAMIPPANFVEMAELIMDGFTIGEIAEAAIYPEYLDEGGADSERMFVKSMVQKYLGKDAKSPINDPLTKTAQSLRI